MLWPDALIYALDQLGLPIPKCNVRGVECGGRMNDIGKEILCEVTNRVERINKWPTLTQADTDVNTVAEETCMIVGVDGCRRRCWPWQGIWAVCSVGFVMYILNIVPTILYLLSSSLLCLLGLYPVFQYHRHRRHELHLHTAAMQVRMSTAAMLATLLHLQRYSCA